MNSFFLSFKIQNPFSWLQMQILTLQITCKNILFCFSVVVEKVQDVSPPVSRKGSREKIRYGSQID